MDISPAMGDEINVLWKCMKQKPYNLVIWDLLAVKGRQ